MLESRGTVILDTDPDGNVKWNSQEPVASNGDLRWHVMALEGNRVRLRNAASGREYLTATANGAVSYNTGATTTDTVWELISR